MTKRGYFIINGIPRVITNQVIRRSGIYNQQSTHKIIKSNKIHIERRCYVDLISQRGTWLRLEMDKKRRIWARMKKSPAIPALLLLQAIGLSKKTIIQTILSLNSASHFYQLKKNPILMGFLLDLGISLTKTSRLSVETGRKFICRRFLNPRSYNLGEDGRTQLNYKFGLCIPKEQTTLTPYDFLLSVDTLIKLLQNEKKLDDIDHFENRRIRTAGELIQNQLNLGLIRLEKKFIDRIKKTKGSISVQSLFTSRAINSIFKEFFGSSPLSQFLDQANPLSELTHKRRLTSIGPGGINRDTAGMTIRGIHPTHYGKICPIETPEGQNAGLVNSITVFAAFNTKNFLETPFFSLYKGQVQYKLGAQTVSSGFSKNYKTMLSKIKTSSLNFLPKIPFTIQKQQKFKKIKRQNIDYIIVSSFQLISIATSLIPFIEHDDANRALMGSNMQRQAVPLINSELPLVGTGLEHRVLFHCSDFLQLDEGGLVVYVSHKKLQIFNFLTYGFNSINQKLIKYNKKHLFNFYSLSLFLKINLRKFLKLTKLIRFFRENYHQFIPLNDQEFGFRKLKIFVYRKIHQNQKTKKLFFNYNFLKPLKLHLENFLKIKIERIIISNFLVLRACKREVFKLIFCIKPIYKHNFGYLKKSFIDFYRYKYCINYFSLKPIFKYKLLKNKVNYNFYMLKNKKVAEINTASTNLYLNEYSRSNQGTALIQKTDFRINQWVERGELSTYNFSSNKSELSLGKNVFIAYLPWEGYNFEDAILINEKLIYNDTYTSLHIEKYKIEVRETRFGFEQITRQIPGQEYKDITQLDNRGIIKIGSWVKEGDLLVGRVTPIRQKRLLPHEKLLYDIVGKEVSSVRDTSLRVPKGVEGRVFNLQISEAKVPPQKTANIKLEWVCVYILEYKKIKIGDKIAGRHGNKGIVSKILPLNDTPFYPDGTFIDMILNPLGVPSRMNIGQIFEALLGLIGKKLYQKFKILPFDEVYGYEASRGLIFSKLYQTRIQLKQKWIFSPNYPGKFYLFDGRDGERFEYPIMSGVSYMMKLIHLVDEKIHARSTGSYSLVTQQPLRGRSKHGGQRFGEMEVWALEGFGVAYTLQELLTVKSDDVKGRSQIIESILKNKPLSFGTPESFKVLIRELQSLCLDVRVYNQNIKNYIKF